MKTVLKVVNVKSLKDLFKGRYSDYVDVYGSPTPRMLDLLCDGNDIMMNKIRAAVQITFE